MKKTRLPFIAAIAASLLAFSCQNAIDPGSATKPETPAAASPSPSTDASLSALSISAGGAAVTLSPAFESGTTAYTATVANAVESVSVAATATDSGAKLSGSGAASLAVGANSLSVVVTAADGTTKKTYTITVTRLALYDATLSVLDIVNGDSSVALSSEFSGGKADYSARLPNSCSSLRIYAKPADPKATATFSLGASPLAVSTTSGDGSTAPILMGSAAVAEGLNEISIVVTGSDGLTKKAYTISATKVAAGLSSEARLESISVTANGSPLVLDSLGGNGEFAACQAFVDSSVTSVVVAATPRDSGGIVYGNGEVSLANVMNKVRVVVTAADGTAIQTMIFVMRAKVSSLSDYVGTWSGREARTSGDFKATIAADGAATLTIAYEYYGHIYSGKAVIESSTGNATIANSGVQDYVDYIYDSDAGTLDTQGEGLYRRVGEDTGSLKGSWAADSSSLDFKDDGTFTALTSSGSRSGRWDSTTITYNTEASDFIYTAYVSPASLKSMVFKYDNHEEFTLTKK